MTYHASLSENRCLPGADLQVLHFDPVRLNAVHGFHQPGRDTVSHAVGDLGTHLPRWLRCGSRTLRP